MALYYPRPVSLRMLQCHMLDVSAASSQACVAVPWKCKLLELGVVLYNAVTVADAVITCSTVAAGSATAITGGTITVTASGSAQGSKFTASPTAQTYLVEGTAIKFVSDGGSTDVSAGSCWALVDLANC